MSPGLTAFSAAEGADVSSLPSVTRLVVKRWGQALPVPCLNASSNGSGDFVGLAERLDPDLEPIEVNRPGMDRCRTDPLAGLALGKAGGLAQPDGAARFVIGHMASVAAHYHFMAPPGRPARAHRSRVVGAGRDLPNSRRQRAA